ncbi:hypothetical protein BJV74DRAFT_785171, partial [Russula compacta]
EWKVRPSIVPTDHWLVLVKYAPKDAPTIGRGRWTLPLKAMENDLLMGKIAEQGIAIQDKIEKLCNTCHHQGFDNNNRCTKSYS